MTFFPFCVRIYIKSFLPAISFELRFCSENDTSYSVMHLLHKVNKRSSNLSFHISRTNQGASLVYHQFRRNCISLTRSVVYHQADEDTHLRCDDMQPEGLMRYTLTRDDMPSLVGLDKQKALANASAFCWRRRRDSNSRTAFATYALSRGASSTCLSTSPNRK